MSSEGRKIAIVLMNLGGPDSPEAVKPFLFNLFFDPRIIRVPTPVRWLIAKIISHRRAPIAREIYAHMGGKSPLLPETEDQAKALEVAFASPGSETGLDVRAFIAMRYWHPFTRETVEAVKAYDPDEVLLLPLYPQFSTTTSQSSIEIWEKEARNSALDVSTRLICCYPTLPGFVKAHADLIRKKMAEADVDITTARVLFSAHGLPRKIIEGGDPYQVQVEATTKAIVDQLDIPGLDWRVTYQSRVGPLEWIGPDTEEEIASAARDGKTILVVPVAFVSEHSETLVELDIEYREIAEKEGAAAYVRVPALGSHPDFIAALREGVLHALKGERMERFECPADRICFKGRACNKAV